MALNDALAALANLSTRRLQPPDMIDPIAAAMAQRRMNVDEALQNLAKVGRSGPYGFASGAIPEDVASDQADIAKEDAANEEMAKQVAADARYNTPEATQQRNDALAQVIAEKSAPAQAEAAGALAVEREKNRGELEKMLHMPEVTRQQIGAVMGTTGAGGQTGIGGLVGPGGTIKPTINAQGGVSFTTTQMPALVQRARNQLLDAHSKTMAALQQAEKMYPGINAQIAADEQQGPQDSTSFGSFLTGAGAPKYGSALDMAKARAERFKYDFGIPTPFSELAQTASFGNIEQMAGQLPGVRGLATITPLFREHQSKWGHETPYQTVRRLHGMANMMEDTIHTLDTNTQGEPEKP